MWTSLYTPGGTTSTKSLLTLPPPYPTCWCTTWACRTTWSCLWRCHSPPLIQTPSARSVSGTSRTSTRMPWTADHAILLDHLHSTVCLCDLALSCFQSYLAGRTECVSLGGAKSSTQPVTFGVPQGSVPQGSVLGPLLFTLYMLPLDCQRPWCVISLLCR